MVGEEPPLGMLRPFSEPAPPQPVYTQEQLKKMATMGERDPLCNGDVIEPSSLCLFYV
jgi:hypothetical protein